MSTCEFASTSPRATERPAVAARVAGVVLAFVRLWKNRQAFYRLGEMTDAELSDIGLTRADLHRAIDGSLASDPTVRLGFLAKQRAATAADLAREIL